MASPTQRTLKRLRDDGWVCDVVERWIPGANIRRDLFGIIDIVALKDGETMGVQTTSYTNVAARVNKMRESPHLDALRQAGWKLLVHGWKKSSPRRYTVREVEV